MKLGPVGLGMLFKDISNLELWQPLCSADRNHYAILAEGIMRNNSVKLLNLDLWFRRKCRLKVFLIWISGSPFVQRSVTGCAFSVNGIMRNTSVKLF